MYVSNPGTSSNSIDVVDLAGKVLEWRYNLPMFFRDIFGSEPYPYQAEFLKVMEDLSKSNALISAGRGTGKTVALSILALWYVFILPLTDPGVPMKVVILAGSEKQAKICYNFILGFIKNVPFLQKALAKEPTENEILFSDGSEIRPATASEKSVRGPHPDLLIIDETCAADDDLIKAALPMIGSSKYPRLVLSSTPDKYVSFFVTILNSGKEFAEFERFTWSAENCPQIRKDFLETQKKLMDSAKYQVEYLGIPYSFAGRVFPLKQLGECVKFRNLIKAEEGALFAGVDWGHSPAPTVITIAQKLKNGTWRVLFTEPFLDENFEDVLIKIEKRVKSYEVLTIYCDSSHIGENQRLASRGLPIMPVKFKSAKEPMISNLRALVENLRLEIDGEKDYPLVAQMRDYSYETKKNDDYVDSLMLAVKESTPEGKAEYSLKDFVIVTKTGLTRPGYDILGKRNVKPEEIITDEEKQKGEEEKIKRKEKSLF